MSPLQPYIEDWDAGIRIVHGTTLLRRAHSRGYENRSDSLLNNESDRGAATGNRWQPRMQDFIGRLSRKRAKSETDVNEVPVCRQNIGDPEFHHDGHRRKIGKRYSRLVGKLFPQFDRPGKAVPGDFFYVNERRLNDIYCEAPRILKWPAFEQESKCFIQDEIRRKGTTGPSGSLKNFRGCVVARIPPISHSHPAPRVHKKFHSGISPYNSSSMFADNLPSEMDPITLRNGSGSSSKMTLKSPKVRGRKTPFFTASRNNSTNFPSSITKCTRLCCPSLFLQNRSASQVPPFTANRFLSIRPSLWSSSGHTPTARFSIVFIFAMLSSWGFT